MIGDKAIAELNTILNIDQQDLLNSAKASWYFGDWDALVNLDEQAVFEHSERAVLVLLISSALHQLGDFNQASKYVRLALGWGVDHKTVARIKVADMHNSLGRIYALKKDDAKLDYHFYASVDTGSKDTALLAQSRAVREMAKLGLLTQAASTVAEKLMKVSEEPSKLRDLDSHVDILKSELEILSHELSIGQQRSQLYSTQISDSLTEFEQGSTEYIESLSKMSVSQLGQDLWVLKKTQYKREGFFVEFGATDGVLLSNTYLLEKEFGWKGICAEPNPKFFTELEKNRACIVSNACISGCSGKKVEFILADEYGGFSEYSDLDQHAEKRNSYERIGEITELNTVSLNDFLETNNAPVNIDYLSIDTEGSEFEILEAFSFDKWNVSAITVEHNFNKNRERIFELLQEQGYQRVEAEFDDWYFKV